MRSTLIKRSVLALAVLAAVVGAVGIGTRGADAQTPFVSAGGPYVATSGTPIQFSGTTFAGPVASASWYFSDGTRLPGLTVVKTFWSAGGYSATLTVTNTAGQTFTTTAPVTISGPYTGIMPVAANSFPFITFLPSATQLVGPGYYPFNGYFGTCPVTPVVINGVVYCTAQRGIEIDPRTVPGK